MGKTQGMTFRISPPRKANRKVSGRLEVGPPSLELGRVLPQGSEILRAR